MQGNVNAIVKEWWGCIVHILVACGGGKRRGSVAGHTSSHPPIDEKFEHWILDIKSLD
jgi:hypothetical protein